MGPTTCVGGGTCLFIARTHAVLRGVQTLEIDHDHPGVSASQPAVLGPSQAELAAGDLQQASEKGWGAAAQMLKAIAEQRSWEHGKHRHLSRAASRLRTETGDRDVYRFFSVANDLHGNFYENEMSAEDIAESLDDVQALLDRLETLLKQV